MIRTNNQRVTIMIDPGNYEEMLVIDLPNITLKNAAAKPGIGLLNKGVDIEPGAVRVTYYYGHGYNTTHGQNRNGIADIFGYTGKRLPFVRKLGKGTPLARIGMQPW
jgi:hypothetical protein